MEKELLKDLLAELFKSGEIRVSVAIYPKEDSNSKWNNCNTVVYIDNEIVQDVDMSIDLIND